MSVFFQNISIFLSTVFNHNKTISKIIFVFVNWCFYFFYIKKVVFDAPIFVKFEKEKFLLGLNFFLYMVDVFSIFFLYVVSKTKSTKKLSTTDFKIRLVNNNTFYFFNNTGLLDKTYLYGLKSIWKHIRLWVLPFMVLGIFMYYSFFIKSLPFSKVFFGYLLLANMFYLFISGFVFFFKKYQYRLYTSAIQRFWRRSLMVFWIIEGTLLSVFVYLIFNASQEPLYMYDNIQIYKTHLFSWRVFLPKIITTTFIIILTYMLLLSIKWNTFTKSNNFVLVITVLLLYVAWLEFYQLFHLLNCYGTSNWVYDFSEHLWNLELEFKRTRIVNHYVTIGLIAKFWHIVFAVVFWVFFILRGVESSRYRYPLLAANLQNFLLVYLLSWLYMYPWFKNVLRKSMDMPYFWFFVNNRKVGVYLFFNDLRLYFFGVADILFGVFDSFSGFKKNNFFYWNGSSISLNNTQFRKHNIRDLFLLSVKSS